MSKNKQQLLVLLSNLAERGCSVFSNSVFLAEITFSVCEEGSGLMEPRNLRAIWENV